MWEWVFGVLTCVVMIKVELMSTEVEHEFLGEVNGMVNIEIVIEDNEEIIEDMTYFFHKALTNLVSNIYFEVGIKMAKVAKERMCSSYINIVVYKLEIVD